MNELLFRQLERMLKEARYESSCHNIKEIESKVLSLSDEQLFEASEMMYMKKGNNYEPCFNFPNITFTFLLKGDVDSNVFKSIKNKIIFWESFANMKPHEEEKLTFLEVVLLRNSDLEQSEVNHIMNLAKLARGTVTFMNRLDLTISKFGRQADNAVVIENGFKSIHSKELYNYCIDETERFFKQNFGFCFEMKSISDVCLLKFLILRHKSFEKYMLPLLCEMFSNKCLYQGFLDEVVLSITSRLEILGFNYDFFEDVIEDRFELYGELDMEDEFEKNIALDIIALEKIVNLKPYPYNSITSWMEGRDASLFSCDFFLFSS